MLRCQKWRAICCRSKFIITVCYYNDIHHFKGFCLCSMYGVMDRGSHFISLFDTVLLLFFPLISLRSILNDLSESCNIRSCV